jgi:hypothetical protein
MTKAQTPEDGGQKLVLFMIEKRFTIMVSIILSPRNLQEQLELQYLY